jgi:hypothetical protein
LLRQGKVAAVLQKPITEEHLLASVHSAISR